MVFSAGRRHRSRWRSHARTAAILAVLMLAGALITTTSWASPAASVATSSADPATPIDATSPNERGSADGAATLVVVDVDAVGSTDETAAVESDASIAGSPETDTSPNAASSASSADSGSVPAIAAGEPVADLSLVIRAERDPILSDSILSYSITVTNTGPAEAVNVVVNSALPSSLKFIAMTGCYLANSTFPECHLNEIASGDSQTFEIEVMSSPDAAGKQLATATVTSEVADPDLTNNSAEAEVLINTRGSLAAASPQTADLAVAVIDTAAPAAPGGVVRYTVEVSNAGPDAARNVEVINTLPAGTTFVSVDNCDRGSGGSGFASCLLESLQAGATRSFEVVAQVDPGTTGILTNTASVSSEMFDSDTSNDTAAVSTVVDGGTIIIRAETLLAGSAQSFPVAGDVEGVLVHGGSIEAAQLPFGSYSATATIPNGWAILRIECSDTSGGGVAATGVLTFNLDRAGTISCTIVYTKTGSITVVSAGAGRATSISGDLGDRTLAEGADENVLTVLDVLPGPYAVTLAPSATGAEVTAVSCVDPDGGSTGDATTRTAVFDVDPGEDVTCTFTSTVPGGLRITTEVVGADTTVGFGGDLGPFTMTTSGGSAVLDFTGLAPGTYVITQHDPGPAYLLNGLQCGEPEGELDLDVANRTVTIDIAEGELVSCIFENTELGSIVILVQAEPDGDPQRFEFRDFLAGSIGDGETFIVKAVPGVVYRTSQQTPDGWTLVNIICDSANASASVATGAVKISNAPGETIRCVFFNVRR